MYTKLFKNLLYFCEVSLKYETVIFSNCRDLIARFDKREEAQEAIARLHGTIPDGGSEPLSVKIAEEHGKQKAAYYAGWQAGYNQSRGK